MTTTDPAAVATRGRPRRDGPEPAGRPPRARAESPAPPTGATCRARSAPPESWYRSSNLGDPLHLGDTGEIPVVRVPRDDEDAPLYPPPHWSERG